MIHNNEFYFSPTHLVYDLTIKGTDFSRERGGEGRMSSRPLDCATKFRCSSNNCLKVLTDYRGSLVKRSLFRAYRINVMYEKIVTLMLHKSSLFSDLC